MSAIPRLPSLAERYRWEAEMPDGTLVTRGGDLIGAVRVSLIPAPGIGLLRHDLIGVEFVHRFIRQFKRAVVGGFDKERHWREIEAKQGATRKEARAARDKDRERRVLPMPEPKVQKPTPPPKGDEVLSVICCRHFRYYVRHTDGTSIVVPEDWEIWL